MNRSPIIFDKYLLSLRIARTQFSKKSLSGRRTFRIDFSTPPLEMYTAGECLKNKRCCLFEFFNAKMVFLTAPMLSMYPVGLRYVRSVRMELMLKRLSAFHKSASNLKPLRHCPAKNVQHACLSLSRMPSLHTA